VVRIFNYKGKTIEELKKMSIEDFARLVPARQRRTLMRGFTEIQKKFLKKLRKSEKPVRTHCREMIIIPEMVYKKVMVYNGKEWISVDIKPEMLGYRLGEFSLTRKKVMHSSPGVGATRSSKFLPLK